MTPERIHLALNHLPIIGLALAIWPLLAGLVCRSRACQITGLALVLGCALSVIAVVETGEGAQDRYLAGPVAPLIGDGGKHWLHEHQSRAEVGEWVDCSAAAVAALALVALWKAPRWERGVSWVAFALAVGGLAAGVWIADAGGKIRRPDFRPSAPQAATNQTKSSYGQ